MANSIDAIFGKHGAPAEIMAAVNKKTQEAAKFVSEHATQAQSILRSEIKYTAKAVVDIVKDAVQTYLATKLERPLTAKEVALLDRSGLYQVIAKEVMS